MVDTCFAVGSEEALWAITCIICAYVSVTNTLTSVPTGAGPALVHSEFTIDALVARGTCTGVTQTEVRILNTLPTIAAWIHIAWVLGDITVGALKAEVADTLVLVTWISIRWYTESVHTLIGVTGIQTHFTVTASEAPLTIAGVVGT